LARSGFGDPAVVSSSRDSTVSLFGFVLPSAQCRSLSLQYVWQTMIF
jgi:hypothetical protein